MPSFTFTFEGAPIPPHRAVRCLLPPQAGKGFECALLRALVEGVPRVGDEVTSAAWCLAARHFGLNPRVEHPDVLWSYPELLRDHIPERYLPDVFCCWDPTLPS
jgi:hypothetical protein